MAQTETKPAAPKARRSPRASGEPGSPKQTAILITKDGELGRRGAVRLLPDADAQAAVKAGEARKATTSERRLAGV
jgi:hypothetical protein